MEFHRPSPATITFLVLLPLIAWRIYSRVRRLVGRQRLSAVRPWLTTIIFPVFIVFIGVLTLSHPERLVLLAAGVAFGIVLGNFGLRRTKFEPTPEGMFYTPNAHLGIALSLLLVGRIAYRFVEIFVLAPQLLQTPQRMDDFARSPSTLIIFGLLAGYYVTYAVGLLRWRFRVKAETRVGTMADAKIEMPQKAPTEPQIMPTIQTPLN